MASSPQGEGAVGASSAPSSARSGRRLATPSGRLADTPPGARADAPSGQLADLGAAVRRFAAASPGERSSDQLRIDLVELRHLCDVLELQFAYEAAAFAASEEFGDDTGLSPYAWLKHHCKMGAKAAWSAICVGQMAARTPLTLDSLRAGRVGFGHVAEMAGLVRAVSGDPDGPALSADAEASNAATPGADPFLPASPRLVFDESALLRLAEQHTVSRFRHDCAHARHAGDPEGFLDEHLDSVASRTLELRGGTGGLMTLRGTLDSVGGAALRSALEPLARRSGADDDRLAGRRLADALVELAHHTLDMGVVPQRGTQRPHLQVTTTLETLMAVRGSPAAELEFSSPIAAQTVARLACDASVTRVVFGPDSAVIDVGRARRVVSSGMRRGLNARDGGCRWSGCDRPASWTQAHHLDHWARGGATTLPNLVLFCHRHHWLVHEGGWQAVLVDGALVTIPPPPRIAFTWNGEHSWTRAPDQASAA